MDFTGKRVLEIGCGSGRLTRKYAAAAAHVDAIDPDEERIERALSGQTAAEGNIQYQALALEDLDAPPGSYDIVILSWSL